MSPRDWEVHLKAWCECCAYFKNGRCPAVVQMRRNTEDEPTNRLFQRLGHCSQYKESRRKKVEP